MNYKKKREENDGGGAASKGDGKAREKKTAQKIAWAALFGAAAALLALLVVVGGRLAGLDKSKSRHDAARPSAPGETLKKTDKNEEEKDPAGKSEDKEDKKDLDKAAQEKKDGTRESSHKGQSKWLRDGLDSDRPMVALTFDDGPYAPVTGAILKVLKKYDGRATFFVVGSRVARYDDVVRRAYAQGCQIATHTYSHVNLTKLSKKKIRAELKMSSDVINDAIGCSFSALRPPGGSVNGRMRDVVKVPMINWNVDTQDWRSRNAAKILKNCRYIKDGDIVLMHDLYPTTAAAVKKLVPRLAKRGWQLVTVDELLRYRGIKAKAGEVYYSAKSAKKAR